MIQSKNIKEFFSKQTKGNRKKNRVYFIGIRGLRKEKLTDLLTQGIFGRIEETKNCKFKVGNVVSTLGYDVFMLL